MMYETTKYLNYFHDFLSIVAQVNLPDCLQIVYQLALFLPVMQCLFRVIEFSVFVLVLALAFFPIFNLSS